MRKSIQVSEATWELAKQIALLGRMTVGGVIELAVARYHADVSSTGRRTKPTSATAGTATAPGTTTATAGRSELTYEGD